MTALDTLDRTGRLGTRAPRRHARARQLPGAVLPDVLDRGAVLAANDLAGIARVAFTRTVDYDKTREQFGRPVGSFQAHQAHARRPARRRDDGRARRLYAAHALDAQLPDAPLAVSVAKAKASDAARDATAAMIQFHGGIGYTWEHDAHLFFKRAKRLEYAYGDAAAAP